MYSLSDKSLTKMEGVNPALVSVVKRAIELTQVDFMVGEGLRSVEKQRMLVSSGKSQTMNSKHLTGRAVDLFAMPGGVVSWEWRYYISIAEVMKQAAKELDVIIEWGGDWKTFKDGVHFQLKG
jgi:peptidoglycan L-alanyl-D-glutamate endopeptidase CwlK